MKRRRWPEEQEDEDGDAPLRSALSMGVKQHWRREYWRHEYRGHDHYGDDYQGDDHGCADYRGDVSQRALSPCVGEQRGVPHVQREDAQPPMPVVVHGHRGVALLGA